MTYRGPTIGLFFLALLVQACASTLPPAVRFPITSGSHSIVPTAQQRILIWADPPLAEVAMEWLTSHHYADILLPERSPFHIMDVSHRFSDRVATMTLAREMNAELVLFVESEDSKDGALIEPSCRTLFYVNVDVRGLLVQSGDVVLRANAHYPHCVDLGSGTLRSLTCQALATAWGYRPSGQLEIPSNLMCEVGQTSPMPAL